MPRIDLGCDRGKEKELTFTRLITTALVVMTVGPSCSQDHRQPATLDPKKVASIVVGSSSRADVFAILGRPSRTERSAQGEAWIYEVKEAHADRRNLVGGVAAASGLVGAVVPYAGLVGSALSLADAATGGGANSEDEYSPPCCPTRRQWRRARLCLLKHRVADPDVNLGACSSRSGGLPPLNSVARRGT